MTELDLRDAQAVFTICSVCGWKSEESPLDRDDLTGAWSAKATQVSHQQYRRHYEQKHRPIPIVGFCYTHDICQEGSDD